MARRVDTVRELEALIEAQAAMRSQLSLQAQAGARAAFAAVTDWYDPKQTGKAVTTAVKAVQAAQRRTASVTDGYLARSTTLITGRRSNTVGAVDVRSLRRKLPQDVIETLAAAPRSDSGQGPVLSAADAKVLSTAQSKVSFVPADEVYGRIPDSVRFAQVARAVSPEQAVRQGLHRAAAVADTDVMLADRAQANKFFTDNKPAGVTGYRRVLHPELGSGSPPCGLCIVAADRVYRIAELMPIHASCRCETVAVGAKNDPGFALNSKDLAAIYEAAGGTAGRLLREIRVEFTEHGELGPILVNADQKFRGPREFARTQSKKAETKILAELESLQAELDALTGRSGENDFVDGTIRWHKHKIRELSARLP